MSTGTVVGINVSSVRGVKKTGVPAATAVRERGLEGDAHAGAWHRQVSLLAEESIGKMRALGASVGPGDFGENITIRGLDVAALPVGSRLAVGQARLEVTQIGKECHDRCAIFRQVGDCIMPREGVFARVIEGGEIRVGCPVVVEQKSQEDLDVHR